MKLYHGSNQEISTIDLSKCRPYKDFGKGFYLTTIKEIESPECNHDNKYDLVIGPVANDDLALLFRQFESGLISIATLVEGMKYKKLTSQYSFHSERAIGYLENGSIVQQEI